MTVSLSRYDLGQPNIRLPKKNYFIIGSQDNHLLIFNYLYIAITVN